MPLVNFTKFIDKVVSGEKTCTIRARRKIPFKVGDALYLYTGARTKAMRRLLPEPVECREAWEIRMWWHPAGVPFISLEKPGTSYFPLADAATLAQLARLDGFDGIGEMTEFFLPPGIETFTGQLIRWKHPQRPFVSTVESLFE